MDGGYLEYVVCLTDRDVTDHKQLVVCLTEQCVCHDGMCVSMCVQVICC